LRFYRFVVAKLARLTKDRPSGLSLIPCFPSFKRGLRGVYTPPAPLFRGENVDRSIALSFYKFVVAELARLKKGQT
jgi:hypothetical protein